MLEDELMQKTSPKDAPIVYQTQMKWLWNPLVYKLLRNTMEMGVCKTNEQMGKLIQGANTRLQLFKNGCLK